MAITFGCRPNPSSLQPEETDQHDDSGSQFTLFSESIEFFIEHEPLEAGEESGFLVHVTNLSNYKPFNSGSVTILIDGVSVTSGAPHHPGIFEVSFVPKKAGSFHASYTFKKVDFTESV